MSQFWFTRLVRHGRTCCRLSIDAVIDVVCETELMPELIEAVRAAMTKFHYRQRADPLRGFLEEDLLPYRVCWFPATWGGRLVSFVVTIPG